MHINTKTFEELRSRRGLTQADVARRAKLSQKTIGRVKRGEEIQRHSAESIAKVLGVTLEHLQTAPDSSSEGRTGWSNLSYPMYRMVVDLDAQALNNLEVASWRYGLPTKSILQYAPMLFSIVAELALARRKQDIQSFASMLEGQLSGAPSYLQEFREATRNALTKAAGAELESIGARKLGGLKTDEYWSDGHHESQNTFLQFLEQLAKEAGQALEFHGCTLEDLCSYSLEPLELWEITKHAECSDHYLDLAEHALHEGQALLRDMPKELFDENAAEQRVMWLASYYGGAKGDIERVDAFFAQVDRSDLDQAGPMEADSPNLRALNAVANGSLSLCDIPEEMFAPERANDCVLWAAKHFGGGEDA